MKMRVQLVIEDASGTSTCADIAAIEHQRRRIETDPPGAGGWVANRRSRTLFTEFIHWQIGQRGDR
jgi:hypothetical protein